MYKKCEESGLEDPLHEMLAILDHMSKGILRQIEPDPSEWDLDDIIRRRKSGIPIDYIFGRTYFMGYEFFCNPETLIPTPETSELVRMVIDEVDDDPDPDRSYRIIDMGTGCGNIAISMGLNIDNAVIFASDLSAGAVEVARRNVEKHDLSDRIETCAGDLFQPFLGNEGNIGSFDFVVCNPPYLPTESIKKLPSEIRDHEPHLALDAGPFGIDFFIRLFDESAEFLKPGGKLVFEIGEGQGRFVRRLLKKNGRYSEPRVRTYNDSERFFIAAKL
ncbi:MAG: peptide chain release factor N(5)-glutamine methyltransferase [Thermoplasmatota archaeon]